jgi:hypothetical protein
MKQKLFRTIREQHQYLKPALALAFAPFGFVLICTEGSLVFRGIVSQHHVWIAKGLTEFSQR